VTRCYFALCQGEKEKAKNTAQLQKTASLGTEKKGGEKNIFENEGPRTQEKQEKKGILGPLREKKFGIDLTSTEI